MNRNPSAHAALTVSAMTIWTSLHDRASSDRSPSRKSAHR